MVTYGDIPQINRGGESAYRKLFYTARDIAIILPGKVQAGYGVLPTGTVLAQETLSGELVPYPPATFDGIVADQPGRAALTVDGGNGETFCYMSNEDSYKFKVGQDIIFAHSDGNAHDGGAITAITRDSGVNGRAKVEFTNAFPNADYTTANSANAYVKSDTSDPYAKAESILDKGVDAGTGENALGALTSRVISNAALYKGVLNQYDSAAKTDLGASEKGQFLILK